MKKYIEKDGYHLKVKVDYELGGMNYFSGQVSKRGYYLYVYPVQIETRDGRITIESFTMFNGGKKLLLEASRKSQKAYEKACAMVDNHQDFIERIENKCKHK